MTAPGGSFVAVIGADISELASEINAGLRTVQDFARDVNRTAQAIKPIAITPTVDIGSALGVLKQLGISVKELAADASGVRVFQAVGRDVQNAAGIFSKLGVSARVVSAETAGIAASAATVAAAAAPAARAMAGLAGPQIASGMQANANAMKQMAVSATATGRSFALVNSATGAFTPLGQRMAGAAVAVGFGLEGMARGGDAAGGGLRQALRAVAAFAPVFGVKGLIVSGVAASTAAIVDMFSRSRDEMKKTAETFKTELDKLVRGLDLVPFEQKMMDLQFGDPTADGAFRKGIDQLTRELAGAKAKITEVKALATGALDIGRPLDIAVATQLADDLAAELKVVQTQFDKTKAAALGIKSQPSFMGNLPTSAITSGSVKATKEAKSAIEQLQASVKTLLLAEQQILDVAGTSLPGLPKALVGLYDVANALLDVQLDKQSALSVAIREVIQDLQKSERLQAGLNRKQFAGVDIVIPPAEIRGAITRDVLSAVPRIEIPAALQIAPVDARDIPNLTAAVERLMVARGRVDLSKMTGDSAFLKEATDALKQSEADVRAWAASTAREILTSGASAEITTAKMRALVGAVDALGLSAPKKFRDSIVAAADTIHELATGARGLLQVASAMGKIGDEAARSVEGVLSLVDSVATLASALATGNLAGVIAGTVGTIGGIVASAGIGETSGEKERKQLQRENNDLIAQMTLALRGFTGRLADLQTVGVATGSPNLQKIFDNARGKRGTFGDAELEKFHAGLAVSGTSYAEVAKIAKDLGITLRDSSGNLIKGAFKDLDDAIAITVHELTHFGKTLGDQRSFADMRLNVDDATDPIAILKSWGETIEKLFPKVWEQFFKGISPSDTKGWKAAEKKFLDAVALDPELLAKLGITKEEFLSLLGGVEGALDAFASSVNAATESLRNVPQWFKIEAFRFNAADALPRSPDPMPTPPAEPGITPSLGPDTPYPKGKGANGVTVAGGLTVNIYESKTPKETAKAVFDEVRTIGRATGDPVLNRWTVALP